MRHLSIRNVPEDLAIAIQSEKTRRDTSLNQVVIDLLRQSLGIDSRKRSNGLAKLAGAWSAQGHKDFEAALASTERIDEEMWR